MWLTEPFLSLGNVLCEKITSRDPELLKEISLSVEANPWFEESGILSALNAICDTMLNDESIAEWLRRYEPPEERKRVGVVMAGNLPLVGFFDMMCVLVAGHECFVKLSSKDTVMMGYIISLLKEAYPSIPVAQLREDSGIDMAIATGSDNSNRYFKDKFNNTDNLLRGTRMSVAVLSGDESDNELMLLAKDVFTHMGMGCRSVSKIFIPSGFPVERLIAALRHENISHKGYLSSYRHNKAILKMRGEPFHDGGFFTLRESPHMAEALPDIIYSTYGHIEQLKEWLMANDSRIQCVVSGSIEHPRRVNFGDAQAPQLWDYPDGADVLKFLGCVKRI